MPIMTGSGCNVHGMGHDDRPTISRLMKRSKIREIRSPYPGYA